MNEHQQETASKSPHVHKWVDKSLLWERPLKVCECGATMTDNEYRDSPNRDERDRASDAATSTRVFRSAEHAMRRGKKAVVRLDDGQRDDGASQVIEELVRYLEDVHGDLYLWGLGEIDAETAMTAIRDTLEGT